MNSLHRSNRRADREWTLEPLEVVPVHVTPAGLLQARSTLAARRSRRARCYWARLTILASTLAAVSAYAGGLIQ